MAPGGQGKRHVSDQRRNSPCDGLPPDLAVPACCSGWEYELAVLVDEAGS